MSLTLTNEQNVQAELPKNMILDLEQFNRDKIKFEDQQKGIRLFLKSNRVIEMNDRITTILIYLRRSIAGMYAQEKLNELDKEIGTQYQEEFV